MPVPPGFMVPTFRAEQVWVQALSEYTPRFTAVIDPFRGMLWLVLSSAAVVTVRASAANAKTITANLERF